MFIVLQVTVRLKNGALFTTNTFSRYNVVALQGHRAHDKPFGNELLKRKAEDEPDAPQLLQWNFVGKIKCNASKEILKV
jgi:hypothetical protein